MKTRALLTILFALALCGCSKPKIRAITPNTVVLAFGDSLTFGYGASDSESYPSVLEDKLGCEVINAGISGQDTNQGLSRLPDELDAYQPNLVILCMGGNDMLRGQSEAQTQANLKAMIELCLEANADVVLIGVPKPGILLSVPTFYEALAAEFDLPYGDAELPKILRTSSLKSDQIHPNAAGYHVMAESIYTLMN
jgi:lysophospholipase L1-like esterase